MRPSEGRGTAGAAEQSHGGVTAARIAAANMLADLRRGDLLDAAFERHALALDARDRRWVQELVWEVLRRRESLDAVLVPRVRGGLARLDADVVDLLRLGVHQLLHMHSVPAYAAIAQTVELAKVRHGIGASRLVNAVLRRVERERATLERAPAATGDPVQDLALRYSHPLWLVQRWVARWGMAETTVLLEHNNREAPLVARPFGVVREQLEEALVRSGVTVDSAPLVHDSVRLIGAPALGELGAFRQGLFFIQDPAATLVARYASFPSDRLVADFCAAPGGKSLEISRGVPHVVAADRSPARMARMANSLERLEARHLSLVVMDARQPALDQLDAVLLDVPCTGTGTYRRHPDARWRLKPSDLAVMGSLQAELLRAAADTVRPGGLLVYSTCSLEPEENDEQVDAFLDAHPGWSLEAPPAGVVPAEVLDEGRLRVLPQRHGADGAFAARLRRSRA